ncbi:MAG: metallophosphoesterase [Sandaracinaceae bacterium]|nr:metallophosphoesterase [Sandaracinaceae bacterium]
MDFTQSNSALIVQVSDLHFGREIHPPASRQNVLRRGHGRAVPGMHPHCVGALRELENEIRSIMLRYPQDAKTLAVVGDLTVIGDDSEFALALTYLRARFQTSLKLSTGLGGLFDITVMVPGNHDHWGGRYGSFAVNPGALAIHGVYFDSTPAQPWFFQKHRIGPDGNIQLQLMGLDSCAGAGLNVAARGRLPTGVQAHLSRDIVQSNQEATLESRKVARLLLCHHSIENSSGVNAMLHAMDPTSRTDLEGFMQTNSVHAILTGHIHSTRLPPAQAAYGAEYRSGSACQSRSPTHEILVHRISVEGGYLVMRSVALARTKGGPFGTMQHVHRRLA